jgi:hypothetical protein
MQNTETTTQAQRPTQREKTTNRQRRKALRLNDRILVWAVDLFQRKTGQDKRTHLYGHDPLS